MYSIRLDIDDTIFDKVMFFLNNIPKKNIEVTKLSTPSASADVKIADFFTQSPLRDEICITRDTEIYIDDRVRF